MKQALAFGSLLLALCSASSFAATETAPPIALTEREVFLVLPGTEPVAFRGMIDRDAAGLGAGAMMYPGNAGLAGLLVGILTHSVLLEGQKSAQLQQLQQAADRVLDPFRGRLAELTHRDLGELAVAQLPESSRPQLAPEGAPVTGWTLQMAPVFTMTRDGRALVLDNAVALHTGNPSQPAFQTVVRVVSNARNGEDAKEAWGEAGAAAVIDEGSALLAHSIRLALEGARSSGDEGPQRSFRYVLGGQSQVERAHLIETACHRATVKTLQGWLMSFPLASPPGDMPSTCSKARYPA